LSEAERSQVRVVLNSERFMDCAPRQVYATLLDEQHYLCHWRTMYRILAAAQEVRERRNQRRQPTYTKPELLATDPNQVLELGHHPPQRSGQMAALLPVRHPGHL
jgi:putative transposase